MLRSGGSGAGGGSVSLVKSRRTSGSITLNSTTWAAVDTGTDLVIPAVATDVLEVMMSAAVAKSAAIGLVFNIATIVSAAPVNYLAPGGASDFGIGGLYLGGGLTNGDYPLYGGPQPYTVQAGDVSGGNVTLRLMYRVTAAGSWSLYAAGITALDFWAKNLG